MPIPSDDAARRIKTSVRHTESVIWPRPTRGRRRRIIEGAASTVSVEGGVGILTADTPMVDSFPNATGDPFTWRVTPGLVGNTSATVAGTEGILLLDWERSAATKEDYIDQSTGQKAPYVFPPTDLQPVFELDPSFVAPDPQTDPPTLPDVVPAWRACVNISGTDIRASEAEPVVGAGYVQDIAQEDTDGDLVKHRVFFVTNVMDMRALPGFLEGTATTGDDDPDLQIPYHEGGATDFKLSSEDCAAT